MRICLDTSAVIYYLHGDDRVVKVLDSQPNQLFVPSIVVLESLHVVRKMFTRARRRPDYGPLVSFLEETRIVPVDPLDVDELVETMEKYSLLPNDAAIALTCRRHGVSILVTLDNDFRRVPWLRILP